MIIVERIIDPSELEVLLKDILPRLEAAKGFHYLEYDETFILYVQTDYDPLEDNGIKILIKDSNGLFLNHIDDYIESAEPKEIFSNKEECAVELPDIFNEDYDLSRKVDVAVDSFKWRPVFGGSNGKRFNQ